MRMDGPAPPESTQPAGALPVQAADKPLTLTMPWGSVDIHFSEFKPTKHTDTPRQEVLLNGEPKFNDFYREWGDPDGTLYDVAVDVRTNLKPGDPHYPFTTDNRLWSSTEPGVKATRAHVQTLYERADMRERVRTYSDLRTVPSVDPDTGRVRAETAGPVQLTIGNPDAGYPDAPFVDTRKVPRKIPLVLTKPKDHVPASIDAQLARSGKPPGAQRMLSEISAAMMYLRDEADKTPSGAGAADLPVILVLDKANSNLARNTPFPSVAHNIYDPGRYVGNTPEEAAQTMASWVKGRLARQLAGSNDMRDIYRTQKSIEESLAEGGAWDRIVQKFAGALEGNWDAFQAGAEVTARLSKFESDLERAIYEYQTYEPDLSPGGGGYDDDFYENPNQQAVQPEADPRAELKKVAAELSDLRTLERVEPLAPERVSPAEGRQVLLTLRNNPESGQSSFDLTQMPLDVPMVLDRSHVRLMDAIDSDLRAKGRPPAARQMFSEITSSHLKLRDEVSRLPGYEGAAQLPVAALLTQPEAGPSYHRAFPNAFIAGLERHDLPEGSGMQSLASRTLRRMKLSIARNFVGERDDSEDIHHHCNEIDRQLKESGVDERLQRSLQTTLERHRDAYRIGAGIYRGMVYRSEAENSAAADSREPAQRALEALRAQDSGNVIDQALAAAKNVATEKPGVREGGRSQNNAL